MPTYLVVQALLVIAGGNSIDRFDVQRRNHRLVLNVAEQRNLAPLRLRDGAVRSTKQQVGLNTNVQQFLDRVLSGLRLQFAGRRNVWDERQMDIHDTLTPEFVALLPDRLEKREALDVTDGPADLA